MNRGRWIGVAAVVIATVAVLLFIGTTHRDNCIKAGDVKCSIAPWSGQPKPKPKPLPADPGGKIFH